MITKLYFFQTRVKISAVYDSVRNIFHSRRRHCTMEGEQISGVTLKFVTDKLKEFASVSLAQSWDNVGLLLEPSTKTMITRILLTNDLTEDVMDEALLMSANLIISYHPPIFAPLTRITNASWKVRNVFILCMLCKNTRIPPWTTRLSLATKFLFSGTDNIEMFG